MGDPAYFRIKSGANPHTRTRWGLRKSVDSALARRQWDRAVETFREHGIKVEVLGPVEDAPGLVFPANAGFMLEKNEHLPLSKKHFYLSNLLPQRAAEKEIYRKFLAGLGIVVQDLPSSLRFEGEADFFPAAGEYILTHGPIAAQRWVPAAAWPPYKRIYGWRTDKAILDSLRPLVAGKKILSLELSQEAYYHGDTVLCAMGKKLEYLMVYAQGLTPVSLARLKSDFTVKPIFLLPQDAARFAANSFYVDAGAEQFLFCPAGLSQELLYRIHALGIQPVEIDVSEFFEKGGGSVKCMLCDLGA